MAFQLYKEMGDLEIQASTITFNSLIDACVRAGVKDKAWSLLGEMKEKDIQPDNFTYSTLIKGIKNETHIYELDKALQLF